MDNVETAPFAVIRDFIKLRPCSDNRIPLPVWPFLFRSTHHSRSRQQIDDIGLLSRVAAPTYCTCRLLLLAVSSALRDNRIDPGCLYSLFHKFESRRVVGFGFFVKRTKYMDPYESPRGPKFLVFF